MAMIICICQNVSERDIARAVSRGCHSFPALQEELEVGTACGSCLCSARESFAEQQAACCRGHEPKSGLMPLSAAV
jgi:bacterioferritin-associated ferredoxin